MTDTEQPLDALRSIRVTQPPPAMSTLRDRETPVTVADTTVTVGLDGVLSTMTVVEPIGLLGESGAVLGGTTAGGRLPGGPGLVYRQPDRMQNRPGADSSDAGTPRRRESARTGPGESTGTGDGRARPPPETPTTGQGSSPTGSTDRPGSGGAGPGVPTAGQRPLPVVLSTNEPGSGGGDATAGHGRRRDAGRTPPPAERPGPELRYRPLTAPEADHPVPPGTATTADTPAGGPDAGAVRAPDTGSTEPPDGERPSQTGGGAGGAAGPDRTPGGGRPERVTTVTGSPGGRERGGTGRTRLERLVERRHAGDTPEAQAETPVETGAPAGVAGVGERDAVTGEPAPAALPGGGPALTPGQPPEPGSGVDSADSNRTGRRQTGVGLTHLSLPEPVARSHHEQAQTQATTGRDTATPGEQPPVRQEGGIAEPGRQPSSTDAPVDSDRGGTGESTPADAVGSIGAVPDVAGRQRARPAFTHLSAGETPADDHTSSGGLPASDSGEQQRGWPGGHDPERERLVQGGTSGVPPATRPGRPSGTVRTGSSGTTTTTGRVGGDEPGDGRTGTAAVTVGGVENGWGQPAFTHLSPGGAPASDRPSSGGAPASDQPSSGGAPASDQPSSGGAPASDRPSPEGPPAGGRLSSGEPPADADAGGSRAGDSGERQRGGPAERERARGVPTRMIDATVTSPASVAGAGALSTPEVPRVDATRDAVGDRRPQSRTVATGAAGRWPETPTFTHLSPTESPGEGSTSPTESPGEGSGERPRGRPSDSGRERGGSVGAGGVPVVALSGQPVDTAGRDGPDSMAVPGEHREGTTPGSGVAQPRSRTVGSGWGQPTFTHLSPGGPRVGDSAERPSARMADRTEDAPGGEPDAGAVPGGAMGRPGTGSGEAGGIGVLSGGVGGESGVEGQPGGVGARSGRDVGPTRGQSPGLTHLLLPAGTDGTGPARTTAPRDGPPVLSTATPGPGETPLLSGGDSADGVGAEPGKDLIDETTQNRAAQAEDMPSLTLQSTGTQRAAGSTGTQRAAGSTGTQRAGRAADTERGGAGTAAGSNQGRQTGGQQRSGPRTDHARRVERSLEPEPDRTQQSGDGRAERRDDAAKTDLTVKTLAPRIDATHREDSPRDITHTGRGNRGPQDTGESVDVKSLFRAAEGGSDRPPAAVDQLVERLYRRIERKMRIERERRGL